MIADLKPYPKYKESGVPWFGEIPAQWEVLRSRFIYREVDNRSATGEETHLSMSQKFGLIPSSQIEEKRLVSVSYAGAKLTEKGDLVLNRLKAHLGVFALARECGLVSPDYTVLRPVRELEARYFEAVYRTPTCRVELRQRAKGIVQGFWRLYTDDFYDIRMPFPPVNEQAAIVRFLDWLNARLERAIRAKRKVIALLNEQKRVIIHRAVTRGLDPSVPLKPSGVPWLGDTPKHWDVIRLKRLGEVKIGLTYSPAEMVGETGTLVLRASNVRNGVIVSADNVYVSKKVPEALLVTEGDILICVRSGSRKLVGKSALITSQVAGVTYGAFMSLLRSKNNAFIFWVLNSNLFACVMAQFETSTINQLTQSDLKNLFIPVPPLAEQAKIAAYLGSATSDIIVAISRLEREIELLREYRTRLVNDVVTGKLDVREAAARLPEETQPDTAEESPEASDQAADKEVVV